MEKTSDQIFDEFESRRAETLAQKRNKVKDRIRDMVVHYGAAASCAFLAFLVPFFSWLFNEVGLSDSAFVPFLFLPICFFSVATVTYNLQREIRELKEQVAKLQKKQVDSQGDRIEGK